MQRADFFRSVLGKVRKDEDGLLDNDELFKKYANRKIPGKFKTTGSGLGAYTGAWDNDAAIHLLRRTTFGLRYEDILHIQTLGLEAAVDLLLAVDPTPPAPPVNNYMHGEDLTLVKHGDPWVDASFGDPNIDSLRAFSFKSWWLERITMQKLNILEKMVLFWHNHFVTEISTVLDARLSYRYSCLLRASATGNFKTLCRAISTDPAMLLYLNGDLNNKVAPDENYARELQELFTIGKDGSASYNEDDVKAAARILTGWRVSPATQQSYFDPSKHDTADKQFSSFYNNVVVKGRTGVDGKEELDELIDMLFLKEETARHICRKLYRFFVYYVIDQPVETDIIEPLAQLLISSDFEIKPVLNALLKSEHFYDMNFRGAYIKSPIDLMAGIMRTFRIDIGAKANIDEAFSLWNSLWTFGGVIGQHLGDPTNVAGWPPYRQSPQFYQIWINSSTTPKRLEFMDALLEHGLKIDNGPLIQIDALEFASHFPDAANPISLTDHCIKMLLGVPLDEQLRNSLKTEHLLSGQASDSYWTVAWNNYVNDPNDVNAGIVATRLASLISDLSHMAEFQLC